MKIFYILITILSTFILAFITSTLLDLSWVQGQWVRVILIHVFIIFELVVGWKFLRELLKP